MMTASISSVVPDWSQITTYFAYFGHVARGTDRHVSDLKFLHGICTEYAEIHWS